MKRTDSAIQQDVMRELRWDTRVKETEVGIEVDRGIVTLSGTVDSWPKKLAAAEAAHRVAGVLDVANDIQVRIPGTPGRTDADVARAIRSALEWDVRVPDSRIQSTVSNGVVTLAGDVDYWSQRDDAERLVRNIAGVQGVTNRIEVHPHDEVTPDEVRGAIEAALERHAERDAKAIALMVENGRVTIAGTVHSWSDRQAVLEAARMTHGVKSIVDRLRIAPYVTP